MKSKTNVRAFRRNVMHFWREHGRHALPWRKTRDPYKILVSEIMLQQTQVDRVAPYFTRWMHTFPNVSTLSEAPLTDVLMLWSGLGYNRRAKMLHECAKTIVATHSGRVPKDAAALRALPGIGSYTAGAIRAFAFNEPDVFIETNIRAALIHHVFPRSRRVGDSTLMPILEASMKKGESAREWYSALMDYGAHIKKMHPNPSRRSKHHTKQSTFEGSLRQMRGEILRARLAGKSLASLRRKDAQRFKEALRSLQKEELLPR